MTISLENGITVLSAMILVGLSIWKWRIYQDRHSILSAIKLALKDRNAFWMGALLAALYLTLFMILGGKGGRIHILFGQWIFNTTPEEMFAGLTLAFLLMISTSLFVYGVRVMGSIKSAKKGGMGFGGAFLALLAAFCP